MLTTRKHKTMKEIVEIYCMSQSVCDRCIFNKGLFPRISGEFFAEIGCYAVSFNWIKEEIANIKQSNEEGTDQSDNEVLSFFKRQKHPTYKDSKNENQDSN